MGKNGGFIFISHSHQDIEKVRKIRNAFEAEGYEPLCFYLKCLSDEDEIDGLIKREIDAREWFVFVNSPNARASRWVTREREYVKSLQGKQIVNIDLENESSPEKTAEKLARNLRVYIACDEKDREFAHRLKDALMARDFQVFFSDEDTPPEEHRTSSLEANIEQVEKSGCVAAIMGENRGESPAMKAEIKAAYKKGIRVIEVTPGANLGDLNSALGRIETAVSDDVRSLFGKAKSHNEAWHLQMNCNDLEEAERLAEEAHDRLDEEAQIRENLLNSVRLGTMKMTPELQKLLDETER